MPRVQDVYAQTVYADAIIAGADPMDAAIQAGFSLASARDIGSKLAVQPLVRARIAEHQERMQQVTAWDAARVVYELADIAKQARDDGQLATARQCIRDIGEHIGMWPKTPVNIDARSQTIALPEGLSLDELRRLASADDSALYIDSDSTVSDDA